MSSAVDRLFALVPRTFYIEANASDTNAASATSETNATIDDDERFDKARIAAAADELVRRLRTTSRGEEHVEWAELSSSSGDISELRALLVYVLRISYLPSAAEILVRFARAEGRVAHRAVDEESLRALFAFLSSTCVSKDTFSKEALASTEYCLSQVSHCLISHNLSTLLDLRDDEQVVSELAWALVAGGAYLKSPVAARALSELCRLSPTSNEATLAVMVSASLSPLISSNGRQWLAQTVLTSLLSSTELTDKAVPRFCLDLALAAAKESTSQDTRSRAVEVIAVLSKRTATRNDDLAVCEMCWRLASSTLVGDRLLACDLAGVVASIETFDRTEAMYVLRTRDKMPTVRVAALKGASHLSVASPTLIAAAKRACGDERAAVRRAAVKYLAAVPGIPEPELVERTRDISTLVRRAAVEALGDFLRRCKDPSETLLLEEQDRDASFALLASTSTLSGVSQAFAAGVFPALDDVEQTVNHLAHELIGTLIFAQLQDSSKGFHVLNSVRGDLCAYLALALEGLKAAEVSPLVRILVRAAQDSLPKATDRTVDARRYGSWTCLELLCASPKHAELVRRHVPPTFASSAWGVVSGLIELDGSTTQTRRDNASLLQARVLSVLEATCEGEEDARVVGIMDDLLRELSALDRPSRVLRALLRALGTMCVKKTQDSVSLVRNWSQALLTNKCLPVLERALKGDLKRDASLEPRLNAAVFVVGELALLGFDANSTRPSESGWVPVDPQLCTLVQALAAAKSESSAVTKAHTFLALGKMSLRDVALAKVNTLVMVQHVSDPRSALSADADSRCNALSALGDLCRRFTHLIEPHFELITRALGDRSKAVRKRAVVVVAGLIQEDYVRVTRPGLFYRVAALCGDREEEIAEAATYTIRERFDAKNAGQLEHFLASTLFAFNGVPLPQQQDGAYDVDPLQSLPEAVATLRAAETASLARRKAYGVLWDRLDQVQRLGVCNRIRRDILGGLLDGNIPLVLSSEDPRHAAYRGLVEDAFYVLADFGLASGAGQGGDAGASAADAAFPAEEAQAVVLASAKIKVMEALERKNVTENVAPLMISLHRCAARERSPVLQHVLLYLRKLRERFPNEMSEALVGHKDIVGEMDFLDRKPRVVATSVAPSPAPAASNPPATPAPPPRDKENAASNLGRPPKSASAAPKSAIKFRVNGADTPKIARNAQRRVQFDE